MVQRFQSLFFLFASIILIMIIYQFPILESEGVSYYLSNHFSYVRLLILFSAALSFFSIFKFRNTNRKKMISNIARLLITISLVLTVFVYKEDKNLINPLYEKTKVSTSGLDISIKKSFWKDLKKFRE